MSEWTMLVEPHPGCSFTETADAEVALKIAAASIWRAFKPKPNKCRFSIYDPAGVKRSVCDRYEGHTRWNTVTELAK